MGLPAAIAILLACHALGCVVPAYYAVKWKTGGDLRETGSGNTGATNAGRVLGKKAYVILALLDIFKGWVACALAVWAGLSGWWVAGAAVAVVTGHIWPAQLGFRGGKGLATTYGVILYVAPWAALFMWAVFAPAWRLLRSMTMGAIVAFLSAPLLALAAHADAVTITLCLALALLVTFTHRQNLREALQRRRLRTRPATEASAA